MWGFKVMYMEVLIPHEPQLDVLVGMRCRLSVVELHYCLLGGLPDRC